MKSKILFSLTFLFSAMACLAGVEINIEGLGKNLGGWTKRTNQAAEYPLSGSVYRTYKPEVSRTPEGGLFVSIRIDHVRGWLASDDHAILEITVDSTGSIESAQSNIAIQGRSISTDMILGSNEAGKQLVGTDRAVQIGTDLVANLSAKLLREKLVEAGRVSFPAALRHNYNLLFQAIQVKQAPIALPAPLPPAPQDPAAPDAALQPPGAAQDLKINPYATPAAAEIPAKK